MRARLLTRRSEYYQENLTTNGCRMTSFQSPDIGMRLTPARPTTHEDKMIVQSFPWSVDRGLVSM